MRKLIFVAVAAAILFCGINLDGEKIASVVPPGGDSPVNTVASVVPPDGDSSSATTLS